MSIAQRFSVKFFVKDPASVELDVFMPIFQRWIQRHTVDGMLIDVVDYKHVINGPGVVLIGHEADYALDMRDGRPGLQYTLKRDGTGDFAERLRGAVQKAISACKAIEAEKTLKGAVTFALDEVEVVFLDRLRVPNDEATFAGLKADLQNVLGDVELERLHTDSRYPLTVRARIVGVSNLEALLETVTSG
jgi:hypothetical protein